MVRVHSAPELEGRKTTKKKTAGKLGGASAFVSFPGESEHLRPESADAIRRFRNYFEMSPKIS